MRLVARALITLLAAFAMGVVIGFVVGPFVGHFWVGFICGLVGSVCGAKIFVATGHLPQFAPVKEISNN